MDSSVVILSDAIRLVDLAGVLAKRRAGTRSEPESKDD